jgi:hypothetical protein
MAPNLPVSDTVLTALLPKIATLPSGIAAQIQEMQGNNPSYRTLTSILRDIGTIGNERAQVLSEVIGYYAQIDSLGKLTALLENEKTDYANQLLAGFYLSDSNLTAASVKLNLLPNSTSADQAYINLNRMLITISSEGRSVFEMTPAEEQLVRNIANSSVSCLARSNARAILLIVFNEDFGLDLSTPSSSRVMDSNTPEQSTGANYNFLGASYPNPAANAVYIPYDLPEESGGVMMIYDETGKTVGRFILVQGKNILEINTTGLSSGVYAYGINIDGTQVETRNMVIINNK